MCLMQVLGMKLIKLYLLQVLFTPATQAARQAACTIVEALTTIPSRKQQVLDLLTRYEQLKAEKILIKTKILKM